MKTESQRAGFTLLELLIVIAMMIFITTIAAVNYFHASRAYSYTTAGNTIFNALQMARQRACVDNKAVYFYLTDTNSFVLQESSGTLSSISSGNDTTTPTDPSRIFYDNYSDASSFRSNSLLVDINQPGVSAIVWLAETKPIPGSAGVDPTTGNPVSCDQQTCVLHVTNNPTATYDVTHWKIGDQYGIALTTVQLLPKGFTFHNTKSPKDSKIIFLPDGTADSSGLPSGVLVVGETIFSSDASHQIQFTIAPNGTISQQ